MELYKQQINICQQTSAMVAMYPYEAESLMRFNTILSLNELSAKADILIATTTSINFVSKVFFWLMVSLKIIRLLLS